MDFSLFVLASNFIFLATTTLAIVPADLRSAGIEYKDL